MASQRRRRVRTPGMRGQRQSRYRLALAIGVVLVALVGIIAFSLSRRAGTTSRPDPVLVPQGEALYAANCAACHGPDLKGTSTGPPFLTAIYAPNHHSDEAFHRAVALGVVPHHWNFGSMPPVAQLTRGEVTAIIAFVRARQQLEGIRFDPSH